MRNLLSVLEADSSAAPNSNFAPFDVTVPEGEDPAEFAKKYTETTPVVQSAPPVYKKKNLLDSLSDPNAKIEFAKPPVVTSKVEDEETTAQKLIRGALGVIDIPEKVTKELVLPFTENIAGQAAGVTNFASRAAFGTRGYIQGLLATGSPEKAWEIAKKDKESAPQINYQPTTKLGKESLEMVGKGTELVGDLAKGLVRPVLETTKAPAYIREPIEELTEFGLYMVGPKTARSATKTTKYIETLVEKGVDPLYLRDHLISKGVDPVVAVGAEKLARQRGLTATVAERKLVEGDRPTVAKIKEVVGMKPGEERVVANLESQTRGVKLGDEAKPAEPAGPTQITGPEAPVRPTGPDLGRQEIGLDRTGVMREPAGEPFIPRERPSELPFQPGEVVGRGVKEGEGFTMANPLVDTTPQLNWRGKPFKTEVSAEKAALKAGVPANAFEILPSGEGFAFARVDIRPRPIDTTPKVSEGETLNLTRLGSLEEGGQYFGIPELTQYTGGDNYILKDAKIADTVNVTTADLLIDETLKDTSLTSKEIERLKDAKGSGYIDYLLFDETPMSDAAKRLGYDAVKIMENQDFPDSPSSVFVINKDKISLVSKNKPEVPKSGTMTDVDTITDVVTKAVETPVTKIGEPTIGEAALDITPVPEKVAPAGGAKEKYVHPTPVKATPEMKAIAKAIDYKGRKFRQGGTLPTKLDSYWTEGTKDTYHFYNVADGRLFTLPTNHPFFEAGAARKLSALPKGVILAKHTIFQGKDIGITFWEGTQEVSQPAKPAVGKGKVKRESLIDQEKITAGADLTTTKARLLKDAAGYEPIRTVVSELLQNSLDAIGDSKAPIEVTVGDGFFSIRDSGKGMTPKVMSDDFVNLFRQGTKGEQDMGGFGFAKLPIMGWPDSFDVISTAIDPETGKKHTSHVWGTREEYMENHEVNFESKETSASDHTPTGTIVTLSKNNLSPSQVVARVKNFANALRTGTNISIEGFDSGGDAVSEKLQPPEFKDVKSMYKPLHITSGESEIDVKFVKLDPYGGYKPPYQIRTTVMNKGLVLPDIPQYTQLGRFQLSKKPNFTIEINFSKTPAASDVENYPFTNNRTRIIPDVESDIVKGIQDVLDDLENQISDASEKSLKKAFDGAPEVGGTKIIVPFTETEIHFKIHELIKSEETMFKALGRLYKDYSDMLAKYSDIKGHTFAITTHPGLHGFRPRSGILAQDYIVVNPFSYIDPMRKNVTPEVHEEELRKAGTALTDTLTHEATHQKVSEHYVNYVQAFHEVQKDLSHKRLSIIERKANEFFKVFEVNLRAVEKELRDIQKPGTLIDVFSDYTPNEQRIGEPAVDAGRGVHAGRPEGVGEAGSGRPVNRLLEALEKESSSISDVLRKEYPVQDTIVSGSGILFKDGKSIQLSDTHANLYKGIKTKYPDVIPKTVNNEIQLLKEIGGVRTFTQKGPKSSELAVDVIAGDQLTPGQLDAVEAAMSKADSTQVGVYNEVGRYLFGGPVESVKDIRKFINQGVNLKPKENLYDKLRDKLLGMDQELIQVAGEKVPDKKRIEQLIKDRDALRKEVSDNNPYGFDTLAFGFDPIAAVKAMKALGKDVKAGISHLEKLGEYVYEAGKTKYFDWQKGIKSFLGDMWEKFKGYVGKVWDRLKNGEIGPLKNHWGAVGKDIGKEPIAKQRTLRRSERTRLSKIADQYKKVLDKVEKELAEVSGPNGKKKFEELKNKRIERFIAEIAKLKEDPAAYRKQGYQRAIEMLKKREYTAHVNHLKASKARLEKMIDKRLAKAAATADTTDVTAPAILEKDFNRLKSLPDIRNKPLSGFTQNPIYTWEDWGGMVGPKAAKWVKDTFYYPIRKATHQADAHFTRVFKAAEAIRDKLPKESGRNIGIHAFNQEVGGPEILKEMGITEIPKLTPEEMKAYKWMRGVFDLFYDYVNEGRVAAGKEPFGKVGNYFTFAKELSMAERLGFGFDDALLSDYIHAKATTFPYAKHRIGGMTKAQLNAFEVFENYIRTATKHMYLSPEIAKIREYTGQFKYRDSEGKLRSWEMSEKQPNAYKAVQEYADFVAGQKKVVLPKNLEAAMQMLNKNITYSTLSGNIRSAMIQPTALLNTYVEIGPYYTQRGVVGLFTDKRIEANKKSKVLLNREFDISVSETGESFSQIAKRLGKDATTLDKALTFGGTALVKISKGRDIINKSWLGMKALKFLDMETATATWIGAYEKAIEVNKLSEVDAVDYADDTVVKTQGSAAAHDLSPAQRIVLGKFFTTFQTFVINNFNWLVKDVMGIKNARIPQSEMLKKAAKYIIGTTLINFVFEDWLDINSPLPSPISAARKEYKKSGSVGHAAVTGGLEMLQLVQGLGGLRYGSSILGAPVEFLGDASEKIAEYGGKGITSPARKAFDNFLELGGDKGLTTRPGVELLGKLIGVPGTSQVVKTVRGLGRGDTVVESLLGKRAEPKEKGGSNSIRSLLQQYRPKVERPQRPF